MFFSSFQIKGVLRGALTMVLLLLVSFESLASVVDGKFGKTRSITFRATTGNIVDQYLDMKRMYSYAIIHERELVVAQTKEEMENGAFNLCNAFDLPATVHCARKPKLRCPNSTVTEEMLASKKKMIFHCESPPLLGAPDKAMAEIGTIAATTFPMKLSTKSTEAIQYVKDMLGLTNTGGVGTASSTTSSTGNLGGTAAGGFGSSIAAAITGDKHKRSVVVHWMRGPEILSDCRSKTDKVSQVGQQQPAECPAFTTALQQLNEALLKSPEVASCCQGSGTGIDSGGSGGGGRTGSKRGGCICYLAGFVDTPPLSAQESAAVSATGFQTFHGIWKGDNARNVKINAVSKAVMELGLMLDATAFIGIDSCAVNDFIEFERQSYQLPHCAFARDESLVAAATATATASSLRSKALSKSVPPSSPSSSSSKGEEEGRISWCERARRSGSSGGNFDLQPAKYALRAVARNTATQVLSPSAIFQQQQQNPTTGGGGSGSLAQLGGEQLGLLMIWMLSSQRFQLALGAALGVLLLVVVRLCWRCGCCCGPSRPSELKSV